MNNGFPKRRPISDFSVDETGNLQKNAYVASTVTLGTAATAPAGIRVDHVVTADGDGCIEFAILQPRSFALYRYEIADGAVRLEVIRKALACAHNARTRETNQKKVPHYAERDRIPRRKVAQT